jgi:4-alpha-glucanotransferase
MSADLAALAHLAGISAEWTDAFNAPHHVSPETLRRVLEALGVACETQSDIAASIAALHRPSAPPPLVTADAGADFVLPPGAHGDVEIDLPSGTMRPQPRVEAGHAVLTAPSTPGYHPMRIGGAPTVLAVAPAQARSVRDLTSKHRAFGSAVQVYSLRRPDDGGIGDFGAVGDAAQALAAQGADALAISPTHALFAAEPTLASPYAPSSRLVLNPLLADPSCLFTENQIAAAWALADPAGRRPGWEAMPLIDWPHAGHAKYAMLRALFDALPNAPAQHAAFEAYAIAASRDITQHAVFEAIHANQLARSGSRNWRAWPTALRRPDSAAVAHFASAHREDVAFHVFLQFLAERSLDDAQARASAAGMGIGLIADLAVGMDGAGSQAWSRPRDMLEGLTVGAPPDLLNRDGQGWGLTTFSPTALKASGFEPFLATLRAAMRHAGGVRIDHVMGLRRLWLVPDGALPSEGAYLEYPLIDFLRLVAIESHASGAVVVGEDLGTVPAGFRETLAARGVLGMRVLPFECDAGGNFLPPDSWQRDAVAMTSTHDLPPIAGWWLGRDLAWRARLHEEAARLAAAAAVSPMATSATVASQTMAPPTTAPPAAPPPAASFPAAAVPQTPAPQAIDERRAECGRFWHAAVSAGLAEGPVPDATHPEPAVDAAIAYVAACPCALAIVPIEDLLGLCEAPNLPGTINEHPNWRRRLDTPLAEALAAPRVAARLATLHRRASR